MDILDEPVVTFSTLVGTRTEIESVSRRWDQLVDAISLRRMVPPRVLPLSRVGFEYADEILSVAVITHPAGLGRMLVAGLRAQLPRFDLDGVVADVGYFLSPATAPAGHSGKAGQATQWSITWRSDRLDDLRRPIALSLPHGVLGASSIPAWPPQRKLALLDTGDEGAALQVGFELDHSGEERATDSRGHGTSVGNLIRTAAPHVRLDSYRVLQRGERFIHSGLLLRALTEVMLPVFGHHVVAVPQRAHISVEERYQQHSVQRILNGYAESGAQMPVLVCAAGNRGPDEPMDYPATVPGALVVRGLDWSGQVAMYNCPPPAGADPFVVDAFGGVEHDPLGTISQPGGAGQPLYGSSYATALVAATLAKL